MAQAQQAGQAQAPQTYSLMDKLREAAYKVFRASVAQRVLELVDSGLTIIPYQDTRRPAVTRWKDLKDAEFSPELVLKLWERTKGSGYEYYGVMLGRPSGHLVLVDIDDVDATKARNGGRDSDAERIVDDLTEKVEQILPKACVDDWGFVLPVSMLTKTRRGVHVVLRLGRADYEKLVERLGKENTELGEAEYRGHRVKVELRVKGVTPLHTQYHRTKHWQLPLPPVSLRTLEKLLQTLGIRNLPTSKKVTPSAAGPQEGNSDVQKVIRSDEKTHTPVTSSIQDTDAQETTRRRLSEQEIARIVEILKNYWVEGHRNNLELGLVGWLIKRGIPVEQAEELIRRLAESAGDEEVRKRIEEVRRQYRLVERGEKRVEELLGKSGLLEQLQIVIKKQNPGISDEEARDRALSVIAELEKILGPRRSRIVRIPYRTGWYFVNDPKRGILLLKEKVDENGQVRRTREYISDWYVRKGVVVRGDGQYIYKLLFVNARTKERWALAGQLDEIVRELKRVHGVRRSQILYDAVSSVVEELIRRGIIKRRKTAAVAGILPYKDSVKLVRVGALSRLLIPKQVDTEKAKQALELLQKLREHYDKAKFDIAINWAAYAPAGYALKKLFHVKQLFMLFHGEKQAGKTTLGRIITSLFPVITSEEEEIPEEGQSEYRLAWKLNVAAVPLLEDEVQGISRKPSLLGLLKRASTGDLVRWRGDQNRRYHARAPLILTSNYRELIDDPALAERIIQEEFTYDDYVGKKSREEREQFKKLYTEYRSMANHLGAVILDTLVEKWDEIAANWPHRLQEKTDYLEFGQQVWRWVAEKLGVSVPEWAETELSLEEERPEEVIAEVFWDVLHDIIAEYARLHRCDDTLMGCLAKLGREGKLPSTIIEWTPSRIIVKAPILREIESRLDIHIIGGLKNLAEKLGLKYGRSKVNGRRPWGIIIPINELIKRIGGEDDVVEYLAETLLFKYNMELWGEKEPVIPRILEEARRLGIEIDYRTADKVFVKLYELARELARQEEGILA